MRRDSAPRSRTPRRDTDEPGTNERRRAVDHRHGAAVGGRDERARPAPRRAPAPTSVAEVRFLQRSAGNRATTQVISSSGLLLQRQIDIDRSWSWLGGWGWATGAQELWNHIKPRFTALRDVITELTTLRDDASYDTADVDERLSRFTEIVEKYDRKISFEEGERLQRDLDALGLPAKVGEWNAAVKHDLTCRKRSADEARAAEQRRQAEEADEARKAEERQLAQEAEASRVAEQRRKAEETRKAEEAKKRKQAEDAKKRAERAAKKAKDPGPSEEQVGLWKRQKLADTIHTELTALILSVRARPADELLREARKCALDLENEVKRVDAVKSSSSDLEALEAKVRKAQRDDATGWAKWGQSVELLATVRDETLRDSIRSHLWDLRTDDGAVAAHVAFLQPQRGQLAIAFKTLKEAHRADPGTAIRVAEAEIASLARYNYDEFLRADMEKRVSSEIEQDIAVKTAGLEEERDTFLEKNPKKTRRQAGSADARDAIKEARSNKKADTASAIAALGAQKNDRIAAGLRAVEDLLATTNFNEDAVTVAHWAIGKIGADPATLRKLLRTYARVSAVPASRFMRLLDTRFDVDGLNWALDVAANDFEAARTYLHLLGSVEKKSLAALTKLITNRDQLARLVLVTLKGLPGDEIHGAVKTLRASLDEGRTSTVLNLLVARGSGLQPAQIARFLHRLTTEQVAVLDAQCTSKSFDIAAFKNLVDKDNGTGSDILSILAVTRITITLADVDTLLATPKFVRKQGRAVAAILESPDATVQITKDLLAFREPKLIYSYIDPTKGSHKASWVLAKLTANGAQTFWTDESCSPPPYTGSATSFADITARAVSPPVPGYYTGGNAFGNYGGVDNYGKMNMLLPGGAGHNEVSYKEYDLHEYDGPKRGSRRMVVGRGRSFYTADHYGTFERFA